MTETRKVAVNNSESAEIMRSEIAFADYNPRTISEDARKRLRKGLKSFGLVGGLVVNKRTGHPGYTLVSGHQRLTEMDRIQGFPGKDYPIRADVVSLSDKEEKELNILLNNPAAMGEWDSDQLARLIPIIDPGMAGLTEADLAFLMPPDISGLSPDAGFVDLQTLRTDRAQDMDSARYESEKSRLSEEKRKTQERAINQSLDSQAYLCLSFRSFARKSEFCARFGLSSMETCVCGEEFGERIERID